MLAPVLRRMLVIQGYLHSDDSPGMLLSLDGDSLRLAGEQRPESATRVRRVVRRLASSARPLGMLPLPGLLQTGRPGKGNHLGGSFPMRLDPGELETDTLGRLPRWDRVHLLDASVLPSIPATTVTLTLMANAHRIASAAARISDQSTPP
jgi:choline dehydrogenase-like flavoprotein